MEYTVSLRKAPEQSLGIGFKALQVPPYCQVGCVVDYGAAYEDGNINEGDLLLQINGVDVTEQSPDEVKQRLASCAKDGVIQFKLRRPGDMATAMKETDNQAERTTRDFSRTRRSGTTGMTPPFVVEEDTPENQLLPGGGSAGPVSHRRSYTVSNSIEKPIQLVSSHSVEFGDLPQYRRLTQHVALQNLITGTELNDRLHHQATILKVKETGCHPTYCVGSHLWPKETRTRPYGQPRTKEEIWPLAEDFIRQYYESKTAALGDQREAAMKERMNAVKKEIDTKGHYELTYEELTFGARTAWRNAPRCVNRIIWRQLEVLDARSTKTTQEMFDAICHHIKYGTNGGSLRSVISVFPSRTRPNADYRVWNPQLIRYAGYRMDDGSILGDPANAEFTEVCMKLGWAPPTTKSQFDILPLVLQVAGGEPQWYEVPRDLVLEVPITHPDYPDLDDLSLKWYALPAVSSLCLDIGGIEFPAVPFNGWYMGTEIGRDLADCNRYNLLKPIALKLGLNLNSKLWKDKALTELNVAIIHSYQKCNVTIVDHHSATESFMTHMKNETLTRGGCPADWVWLVPPVSGSLCPVFHQEMLLYYLSPSYEYQDDPWKHHTFPSSGRARERYKFKTVAEMVRQTARMFHHVYQKRVKATILYATETGRSKNYASIVKDFFGRNFASQMYCMENYNRASLEHEQMLVIVTSTFGSGDPPANGESFGRYLLDVRNGTVNSGGGGTLLQPHRKQRMSTIVAPSLELLEGKGEKATRPLTQVKYAVFGLGSRAYPNFCTFAHTCDNLLKDLGAEQVCICGEGDELCGQEESFQFWLRQCYMRACQVYQLDPRLDKSDDVGFAPAYSKENYRVQIMPAGTRTKGIREDLEAVHGRTIGAPVVKSRSKLQAPNSDRSTILVCLDLKGLNMPYVPGDHVGIYPQNNAKLVAELLERLALPLDPDLPVYLESRRENTSGDDKWVKEKRLPIPVTLREAFTNYLDITTPPTPQFLKLLSKLATRAADQADLEELAKGGDVYEDWKYERFPNLFDVVNQFHSLKIDATLLLHHLPLLQCRYYSISSSPSMYPNELHLTVAVVSFKKRNGQGPRHNGVCSTWLNRIEIGSHVPCFIRRAPTFHLPEDPKVPIIMVGPGTGIAPFRSFWQERMFQRNEALKSQLAQSNPIPLAVTKPLEKPEDKRRRKTAYVAPKITELQMAEEPVEEKTLPQPILMRRSVSDSTDNQAIALMIAQKEKSWGAMELYFGCRTSDVDHIYKDEMTKAHLTGALSAVHVALSRQPGQPKTYVQHILKKNAESIVRMLIEERGHFYVCGDISMAAEVCRNLQNIFEDNAAMSAEEARQLIESMKDNGFYHEDIFGVTLKTAEVTTRVRTAAKRAWRILVSSADNPPQTPVTPYPNRLPTNIDQFSSDTLTRPNQLSILKRPTVTVLMTPGSGTPTSPMLSPDRKGVLARPSAPEMSPGVVGTKRRAGLQAMESPNVLESPRLQLLDPVNESEVEMFLQPPEEDVEYTTSRRGGPVSKPPSVVVQYSAIQEEEAFQVDEVTREMVIKGGSPTKKGSPVKGSSPAKHAVASKNQLDSEGDSSVKQGNSFTITVDDSSGVLISKEDLQLKESVTSNKTENESKDAVIRREGASERRQMRRIRTNSQVETII